MKATRRRDTAPEAALWEALRRLGVEPELDYGLPGGSRRADAALVGAKIAIFVDGCFWHGCPEHGTWPRANAEAWRLKIETNRARDRSTDERLANEGWTVIRAWEHQNPDDVAQEVASAIARSDSVDSD